MTKNIQEWCDKTYGKTGARYVPNLRNPIECIVNELMERVARLEITISSISESNKTDDKQKTPQKGRQK